MVKRIFTILIPYLVWNTIAVVAKLMMGETIFEAGIDGFVLQNYIFRGRAGGAANGPLWYMFRLFEYVLCTPIICLIVEKRRTVFAGCMIVVVALLNLYLQTDYFDWMYFFPIYLFGALCGSAWHGEFEGYVAGSMPNTQRITGVMLSCLFLIILGYASHNSDVYALSLLGRYLSIFAIIVLLKTLPRLKGITTFMACGGGMWLYCMHFLCYSLIRPLLLHTWIPALVCWCLLLIISSAGMYVSWYLLYRFCKPLLSFLVGGRTRTQSKI